MLPLLLATAALAAPTFLDHGLVIRAPTNGEFSGGVSAPTVEYDATRRLFVLYFESPRTVYPSDCAGSYEIGRATSRDGVTWRLDAVPVLKGDDGDASALDHCGVSQPAIVFDGQQWHLFYTQAGARTSASWPGNEPGGIAYATSPDGIAFTIVDEQAVAPSTDRAHPIGLPSATIVGGEIQLYYSWYPDVYLATFGTDPGGGWVDEGMVLDHADADFSATWLFGPSLTCHPTLGWSMLVGGDGADGRAYAMATSEDAVGWTYDAATPLSAGDVDYAALNHVDVLRAGNGRGWAMWYATPDPDTGKMAIGHAATAPWAFRYLSRACY